MTRGRLSVENYRGVPVPMSLGPLLFAAALASTLVYALAGEVRTAGWGAMGGLGLVFAAGLIDDITPSGPRGLRNHLRALAAGRVTSGVVKLVVAVGAAVVVVGLEPASGATVRLAGIVLIASSANVWNGLDVRPGRAIKAFLPAALPFVLIGEANLAPALPGLLAGAAVALPLDLAERAMLGDGGSNLLGFAAGLGLYLVLPAWGVVAAAFLAVGLNLLAETVSLTRAIEAVPPLGWLDRLGRRPENGP